MDSERDWVSLKGWHQSCVRLLTRPGRLFILDVMGV